jgi:pyruvate ferredoxin oxidoreductase alpha subunit
VRYLAHYKQMQALDLIPEIAGAFEQRFGRTSGGLLRSYRSDDADTIVVALGSVLGTVEDVIDELRDAGVRIGALGIRTFRPWPRDEVRAALEHARHVIVLEKALSIGIGGIVAQNVHGALQGLPVGVHTAIAGLGGRPITKASLRRLFSDGVAGELPGTTFVDLDHGLVDGEIQRMLETRRSGAHAENLLRDIGVVGAGPV